jgi:hypothetical protein
VRVLGRLPDFDVCLGLGVQSPGTRSNSRVRGRRRGLGSLGMGGEVETDTGVHLRAQQSEQRNAEEGKLGEHVQG